MNCQLNLEKTIGKNSEGLVKKFLDLELYVDGDFVHWISIQKGDILWLLDQEE